MNDRNANESQIEDEAADWTQRLSGEVDKRTLKEFEERIRASPKLAHYFLRHATMDTALREALSGKPLECEAASVEPASKDTPGVTQTNSRLPSHPMKVAAVVVGVALALGLGIWLGRRPSSDWIAVSPSPQSPHEVILTDGSTVRLPQPCERLFVRYSRHSRDLRMQECSAEFKVTRGDDRTFRVAVIGGTIEARGTEFGVRWTGQSSDVWVIEGRVVVRGASEPGKPIDLAGKESAELSADGHVPVVMRKFENVTLMEVAKAYTEVHSMPQFQFKDGSASLRFSGTVNVADADNIIGIFPTYPELEVERSGDVVTVRMDK